MTAEQAALAAYKARDTALKEADANWREAIQQAAAWRREAHNAINAAWKAATSKEEDEP